MNVLRQIGFYNFARMSEYLDHMDRNEMVYSEMDPAYRGLLKGLNRDTPLHQQYATVEEILGHLETGRHGLFSVECLIVDIDEGIHGRLARLMEAGIWATGIPRRFLILCNCMRFRFRELTTGVAKLLPTRSSIFFLYMERPIILQEDLFGVFLDTRKDLLYHLECKHVDLEFLERDDLDFYRDILPHVRFHGPTPRISGLQVEDVETLGGREQILERFDHLDESIYEIYNDSLQSDGEEDYDTDDQIV